MTARHRADPAPVGNHRVAVAEPAPGTGTHRSWQRPVTAEVRNPGTCRGHARLQPVDANVTGGRMHESSDHPKQCRLSCAIRAKDAKRLSAAQLEGHAV